MIKRLEQEALRADLASVDAMHSRRTPDIDPVGWFQLSARKSQLEQLLTKIATRVTSKSVALIFGGNPVVGAHGIAADFGASIISNMQSLMSAQSASQGGGLGREGQYRNAMPLKCI